MKHNRYQQMVFDEADLFDLAMQGRDLAALTDLVIDPSLDLDKLRESLPLPSCVDTWRLPAQDMTPEDFHSKNQSHWHMPEEYRKLDIARHIVSLCKTDAELQRVGQELLLYQDRGLFDLLRYLKYLVDVMRANNIIWGVGRGSSVASYVLFLLGVHRIDSMYYDLDPGEFLR